MSHYQPNPTVVHLETNGRTSQATLQLVRSMGDLARPESISDEVSENFNHSFFMLMTVMTLS
jgi:hypothetical protein